MKYWLCFLFAVVFLVACDNEGEENLECTIQGRWIIEGIGESTLYEFTDSLRYTIYSSTAGEFGTIEEAIPNPNDHYFMGDSLVIDLNFDNYSITKPNYKCDCNVVELVNSNGVSILYKEDYNYEDCDE